VREESETEVARRALAHYGIASDAKLELVNLSENATFLVAGDQLPTAILRLHRENYHSASSIGSELDWVDALRTEAGVKTAGVIPAINGRRVVSVPGSGADRHVVMFEKLPGTEPDEAALTVSDFEALGEITARLHSHSMKWSPPQGFSRFAWTWETTLGDQARWGRWQETVGIDGRPTEAMTAAASLLCERLAAFGTSHDRFGLVHADLRPANLLVNDGVVQVIDFDDCGYSWFLYDFGTAVSFMEDDPRLAEWQAAWLAGYRGVRPLSSEEEGMLATFVMLRRFLLVAWMGSHAHSREAQAMAESYARGSEQLAESFVASGGAAIY